MRVESQGERIAVVCARPAEWEAWLHQLALCVAFEPWCQFASLAAGAAAFEQAATLPLLIVVLEDWPDEFSAGDVSALLAAAPLAEIVCVGSVWSESVLRSRSTWPPSLRVPLWRAWPQLALRWRIATRGASFRPWTASPTELAATDYDVGAVSHTSTGHPWNCLLVSPDDALGALWVSVAQQAGASVVRRQRWPGEPDAAFRVALVDQDGMTAAQQCAIERWARWNPTCRLCWLTDHPLAAGNRRETTGVVMCKLAGIGPLIDLLAEVAVPRTPQGAAITGKA